MISPIVKRLMDSPYGHTITRDKANNSHVTIFNQNGAILHTIVAPTFDEAVTRALDLADQITGAAP